MALNRIIAISQSLMRAVPQPVIKGVIFDVGSLYTIVVASNRWHTMPSSELDVSTYA